MNVRLLLIASNLLLLTLVTRAPAAPAPVDFARHIKPILERSCVKCHGPARAEDGFRLDSIAGLQAGSKSGKVLVPGNAMQSKLFKLISLPKDNPARMPQESDPLSAQQIALIRDWINQGAKWPAGVSLMAAPAASGATGSAGDTGLPISAAETAAVTKLEQAGVLTLRLAQNVNWLRVDFSIRGKQVSDAELALLKSIPNLVELGLGGTDLIDTGAAHLRTLKNLTRLQLQNTRITDAALVNLKGLDKLASLNLYGTQVTDQGLDQLSALKNLRDLYLWQTKATVEGAKKLAAAIPELTINLGHEVPPVRAPKPPAAAEKE